MKALRTESTEEGAELIRKLYELAADGSNGTVVDAACILMTSAACAFGLQEKYSPGSFAALLPSLVRALSETAHRVATAPDKKATHADPARVQ